MNDEDIERELVAKGKTAPRITPEHINSLILTEQYYVFPGTTLTVCALTLKNGYQVVGYSAAASPENFDESIGRKIACRKAYDQIWALEGYLLRQRLYELELKAQIDIDKAQLQALGDRDPMGR